MKEAKLRSLNTVWPQIYNILGKGKLWRQSKENKSELGVWKDEWVQEKGNGKLSNIISDIRNLKVIFLTLKKGKLDKLKISNFYECFVIVKSGSCVWLSATPETITSYRLLCPWDFPGKNTGLCYHFLLQGIFLIQAWSLCLLHWQVDSLSMSHQWSPLWKCLVAQSYVTFCDPHGL